jgi:hypothetical protein
MGLHLLTFMTLISVSMVHGSNVFTTRKFLSNMHVAPSTTISSQQTLYDHVKRLVHDAPNPPKTNDPHPSPYFDAINTGVPAGSDPILIPPNHIFSYINMIRCVNVLMHLDQKHERLAINPYRIHCD